MSDFSQFILDYLTGVSPNPGLGLNPALAQVIIVVVMTVVWVVIGVIGVKVAKLITYKTLRVTKGSSRALTVAKLLVSLEKYLIWFIVALLVLGEFNVNITPFLASAGVIGLAIGFGAQEIVQDFISGFFIIFEGAFNVDDVVEVDGFKGKVVSLGLRTTIIQNWLGERKIINNGKIGSIINFSRNDSIAIIDFGVAYSTDLEKLSTLMVEFEEEMLNKYEILTERPQFLGVTELADSSINVRLIAKAQNMQHFQVERNIRKDVVAFLTKHNISIPFPHVVVKNA
jgi:small conductance mechanosensitive channel